MLTEREVLELSDRMMSHVSLLEKYGVYARQCQDPQVRDLIVRHQQVLQNHYNTMAGFIQNAQGVTGGISPQAQWRLS